jgi:hypothetical protein
MKDRVSILFLSFLLLMTVSYVQIFHKMSDENIRVEAAIDLNADAEEGAEKTSEENSRETDQDEDPLKLVEIIALLAVNPHAGTKNVNYSFGLLKHYREIVSPPPQG